ncbi:PREDICTED: nucleolar MIF4G domain-containing protein 1-like [Habropoda laboriosa]|uniref:nucleolar MIF4G domain-containing protein 1-like n=1 Tax=Habropoda laboriosa TaxID=597456 RepID=UPI00083D1EEF|nr:PREDICTED: nucleolar MIF4G domain-containing protein 1-like [Habropoda laboriosa]
MGSLKHSKTIVEGKKCSNLKLVKKSRKQMRKDLRKQKKINKVIHSKRRKELRTRAQAIGFEKTIEINDNEINNEKIVDNTVNIKRSFEKCEKEIVNRKLEGVECKKENKKKELLRHANSKEDKIIKRLEKQLKLNKRKRKTIPKSFVADGLDYLLDFCLEKDRKCLVETEKEHLEIEFNLDDLKSKTVQGNEYVDSESDNGNGCESKSENENESSDVTVEEQFNNNNDSDKISWMKQSKTIKIKCTEITKTNNININNEDIWEDIYGRKRDKEGNIIHNDNRYVPPAARIVPHNINPDDEKLHSLKKQLKGYLNRVTEHNMHYITNQIEAMYMTNSRNNMNYVLSELTIESLVSHVITPDRLICEHMMLVTILHANIGVEIGASFLEKLIKKFIDIIGRPQDVEDKKLDNVALMLSHLYNFKVYGYKLLYQILDKLMMKFTEKEIELILLILKTVGFSLRKDDPNALKEFIQNLQRRASHEKGENSRIKFMLEILLAIKNNNINKIPQYDPSHVEHLKKVMKSIIRRGNTIIQFHVSLEDLLHADENGKWWIIGSAWSGPNNVHNKAATNGHSKLNFDKKMLDLAQKQRMNTDTRRNIFCILMTAEDYLDAFEKLHQLGLKDQQEREIIHVLMHCCLQENKFNLYYAVLAEKLCEYNRKYQLTIQYTFWDKLKTLEMYGNKQLSNLAQFLTYLFIEKCLALSVLKVIQFTELDKHTMEFLRKIILEILLHENEQACLQVFERISVSPQLQTFRESLRLFINCFLIKNLDSHSILDKQKIMLKNRAVLVDKVLISHESKTVF